MGLALAFIRAEVKCDEVDVDGNGVGGGRGYRHHAER